MSKKQNSNFVLVEDFDLIALKKAFDEGRLYIQPSTPSPEAVREEGIRQILQYVSRIDDYTTTAYISHIRALWQAIVQSPMLSDLFFLTRYASSRGQVNWYRVNVVICLLLEMGVYRKEFTGVDLHCCCEGTTKKGNHYLGMYRYQLETRYRAHFRRLLGEFRTQSENLQQ